MRATKVKGMRGDRGSNEKVGRDREGDGKLDSWPPGGIRPSAKVCALPTTLPSSSHFPKLHLPAPAVLHS